jgi:phospholipase C
MVWERLERRELNRLTRRGSAQRVGERPDPARPAGTDLLPQIKHIIVLMMENHSYDNYLGTLAGRGDGFALDEHGAPDAANPGGDGEPVRAYRMPGTVQLDGTPCQSWHAAHLQWAEGKLDGFVTSTIEVSPDVDPAAAMGYWTEEDLPFYHGLARTFPLADRWFSSCLGPTFPNRRFLLAGTANGLIDDLPIHILDYPQAGTILDQLSNHQISWANYRPAGDTTSRLRRYVYFRRRKTRRRVLSHLRHVSRVMQGIKKDMQFTADLFPLGIARFMLHVRSLEQFFADADNGTLPAFSIVDPDFDEYSEENPQDVRKGESFAAEVITRVMHGKGWPHTLLIWLYDEHGGYYDHVPPPPAVPPDDIEGRSFLAKSSLLRACLKPVFPRLVLEAEGVHAESVRYDTYGFRVPAVFVSPYARPDCVLSDVFDHTSVLKLIEQKWNLPALTRRDAAALSPIGALDLTGPPAFLEPPALPAPALPWGSW